MSKVHQWPVGVVDATGYQKLAGSKPFLDRVIEFVKGQGTAMNETISVTAPSPSSVSMGEGPTKAQFMADLKKASRPLVAGPKLSREEASRRIDEKYGSVLKALGDE